MIVDRNFKFILVFSFLYFLLSYSLAIDWYQKGYFSFTDTFFDADPDSNLLSLAHGWGWGRNTVSHAFLEFYTIPIRIIEIIYSNFFIISDRIEFRELISLSICPVFSSLSLVYVYRILTLLNLKTLDANIFTLIFSVSFTNVIFAVIPETFAISSFLISYLIFYFFKNEKSKSSGNIIIWLILAIFLSGITITNIFTFHIVFMIHLVRNEQLNWINAIRKSSFYSIIALFIVIIIFKFSIFLLEINAGTGGSPTWVATYLASSFFELRGNIVNLFSSSINSFIGAFPTVKINNLCGNFTCNMLSFTRHKTDFLLLGCVAIIWSVIVFYSKNYVFDKKWKNLYLICLLIIAFNFSLHAFFGQEMFLYTQHWITPLFLLLVPVLQKKRFISISFLLLLIITNVNFLFNVEQLIGLK